MASYDWIELKTPEAYDRLIDVLDPEFDPKGIAQRLKTQLTDAAKGVLVEHGYVDKDYRSTFYYFYAKMGRPYRPDCVRLHFFDSTVSYDETRTDLSCTDNRPQDHYFGYIVLRVRPETLWRITEFSEHESNGRELDEGERVAVEVLPVLGQSAAAVEPGDGAFDHPTPGLDDEALHPIGSLDDLGLEIGQDAGQGAVKDRPLIGAVGEQFPEKGKQTEQGRQQRETAVAILNVGGGDDAVQQQALRIDQNMPLLALDQLAGIEAVAVDASPPFSALFTL